MSRRKRRALRQVTANPAAPIATQTATQEDEPLDVLLGLMRDHAIDRDDRIEIAKMCLPFVHPRIARVAPAGAGPVPEPEPGPGPKPQPQSLPQKQIDVCDTESMIALVRRLNDALAQCRERGLEVSHFVWHALKYLPRTPDELKAPAWQRLKGFT